MLENTFSGDGDDDDGVSFTITYQKGEMSVFNG